MLEHKGADNNSLPLCWAEKHLREHHRLNHEVDELPNLIRFHCCQQRAELRGCSDTDSWKPSLFWWMWIFAEAADVGGQNLTLGPTCLVSPVQADGDGVMFPWHTSDPSTQTHRGDCHSLSEYCWCPCERFLWPQFPLLSLKYPQIKCRVELVSLTWQWVQWTSVD